MPQVVGTALLWTVGEYAATEGLTILGVSLAEAVGTVAIAAATIGLQYALTPTVNADPSRQQVTTRQPVPARRRYYGRCKAGGPLAFIGSKNGDLMQVIMLAAHEIDFAEHWIGDREVTVDGSGNVTAPASMIDDSFHRFHVYEKSGSATQTAHAKLIEKMPDQWTSDHRLLGIANVLFKQDSVEAKKLARFYPGGPQAYRAVFDAARVWDVNDDGQDDDDESTWDFGHDNAANVIRDYLTHRDGWGWPSDAIALTDFEGAASDSDTLVAKKGGGTIPRYRLAGGYDINAPPKETLAKMLAACDGYLHMKADGTVGLKVGAWEEPTVTLADPHILGFSLPKGLGPLRQANEIRATFTDPERDYQPTEAVPWRDEADILLRGEVLSSSPDLSFAPHHNQARRVMKIAAARANPERKGTLTTDLYGLNALGERRIHVVVAARNIGMVCEVDSVAIDVVGKRCTFGVTAITSAAYTFDADDEEGDLPDPVAPADDNSIDAPEDFDADATSGSRLAVSCTAPDIRNDLQFHVEYSVQGSDVWTGILIATLAYEGVSSVLAPGIYDVRGWFNGPGGTSSDYATLTDVVIGSIDAPSSPVNLTHTGPVTGAVTVIWQTPNDANAYACRVWRGTAAFGAASDITGAIFCGPNQALSYIDTPGSGTWKYWVTAESATGASSAETGPETVVV